MNERCGQKAGSIFSDVRDIPSLHDESRSETNANTSDENTTPTDTPINTNPVTSTLRFHVAELTTFRKIRVLGEGISGTVYEVEDVATNEKYAMKALCKRNRASMVSYHTEREMLRLVCEEISIKLYCSFEDAEYYYIVTQLGCCSLLKQVASNNGLNEFKCRELLRQILKSVMQLHRQNIVHRDIKLDNIVFTDHHHQELKLVDFAVAKFVKDEEKYADLVGTLCCMSPERFRKHKGWELKAADIWAIGVVGFEMLTAERCFASKNVCQLQEKIERGSWQFPESKRSQISWSAQHFIGSLLNMDPKKRPTAKFALNHPWMTGSTHPTLVKYWWFNLCNYHDNVQQQNKESNNKNFLITPRIIH